MKARPETRPARAAIDESGDASFRLYVAPRATFCARDDDIIFATAAERKHAGLPLITLTRFLSTRVRD